MNSLLGFNGLLSRYLFLHPVDIDKGAVGFPAL
jgi:hypothetical protein